VIAMTAKLEVGLFIERVVRYGTDRFVVRPAVRHPGDDHPSNANNNVFRSWNTEAPAWLRDKSLGGIEVTGFTSTNERTGEVSIVGGYRATATVTYADAEELVAIGRMCHAINRAIGDDQRKASEDGIQWEPWMVVNSVARAVKAKWVAVTRSTDFRMYSDVNWTFEPVQTGTQQLKAICEAMLAAERDRRHCRVA